MVARSGRKETRRATYQDVLDAPPHKVAEVIAGSLHAHPRPASRHAWASSGIGAKISPPFNYGDGGPGGWWIVFEPELHLAEDIVVPDLAGWRRETMPEYPDAAYFTIAPDWVCEVLSPSTRRLDLSEKRALYAREGVRHLWFVDPDARTLEAFELRDGQWVLLGTLAGDAPVSLPPFDAITFPLDALWPEVITKAEMADNGDGS
ncbi:MAG: Uma2 family endonuclease [Boseongicola sp. SB0677_bin_26]|nr:Uma2 family endonuclease [Boseongicola sp. SB0665_bin_10]MYG28800.1 Uma2 family endonuclease [Boseongicola sp. SB0677_bin_26]